MMRKVIWLRLNIIEIVKYLKGNINLFKSLFLENVNKIKV